MGVDEAFAVLRLRDSRALSQTRRASVILGMATANIQVYEACTPTSAEMLDCSSS